MTDTTIYGYLIDGLALHPDCADLLAPHEDPARELYYMDDDDKDGLFCDECGNYIFEPNVEGQLTDAIEDIISRMSHGNWEKAEQIVSLFLLNGFEYPERFES